MVSRAKRVQAKRSAARKRSATPSTDQAEDDGFEGEDRGGDGGLPSAGSGTGPGPGPASHTGRLPPARSARSRTTPDPSDADEVEVRYVQPYQATKAYLCPGCNREIPQGVGHMVAVPLSAPDLRRHWHRGCWTNRRNRY